MTNNKNKNGRKVFIGINSSGKSYSLKKYENSINITSSNPTNDSKLTSATQVITDRIFQHLDKSDDLKEKFDIFSTSMDEELNNLNNLIIKYEITDSLNESIISTVKIELSKNSNFADFFKKSIHNLLESKMEQLGEGHKQIYLVKLLLFNNVSGETFTIDEPETFLHPSLIKDFAILLNKLSEKNEIVATSHSSLFVKNFVNDLSEIEIVDPFQLSDGDWTIHRDKPNIVLDEKFWKNVVEKLNSTVIENEINIKPINVTRNNFGSDFIKDDFFDYDKIVEWKDKHLTEIIDSIFWRNSLLAEGLIENIIFNFHLDNKGWQLIGAFGKFSMPVIGCILEELGINVAYLLDRDDEGKEIHLEFNKFFNNKNSLFMEKNMEEELNIETDSKSKNHYVETKYKILSSSTKEAVFDKINIFLKKAFK